MRDIDPNVVAEKYNKCDQIWSRDDKWHLYTKKQIDKYVYGILKTFKQPATLLNAGSGGTVYSGWENSTTHLDIAAERLKHLEKTVVGDLHAIPIASNSFDIVVCVGSVINYCDALIAYSELARVVRPGGHLILEFENSYTFELLGTKAFNNKATLINTFYKNQVERLWYYSESYIRELTFLHNMKVVACSRFHLLSPLILRFTNSDKIASKFARLDKIISRIPLLKQFSSNVILHLTKLPNAVDRNILGDGS